MPAASECTGPGPTEGNRPDQRAPERFGPARFAGLAGGDPLTRAADGHFTGVHPDPLERRVALDDGATDCENLELL